MVVPPPLPAACLTSSPTAVPPIPGDSRIGTLVGGSYRVEMLLARGGMSVIYKASRLRDGRSVALKIMAAPPSDKVAELRARVAREVTMLSKLKNAHVAHLLGSGTLDGGAPFVALEYLEGRDLRRLLVEDGPLPLAQAVDLLLEACEALAEAHAIGIVHRDLKPENLFLDSQEGARPTLKIIDFGIAKWSPKCHSPTNLTRARCTLGSPEYMSPEQMEASEDIDERTDLWSLGILLYELVAGTTPYKGAHLAQLMRAIVLDPPPSLESNVAGMPAGIDHVLAKLLAADLPLRVATVEDAARLLAPFGSARATASLRRLLLASPATRTKRSAQVASRDRIRGPRLLPTAVVVVAAMSGIAAGVAVVALPIVKTRTSEVVSHAPPLHTQRSELSGIRMTLVDASFPAASADRTSGR